MKSNKNLRANRKESQLPLEIKSGTRIKLEHFNWVLIPSNYQYENRRTQLISLLKKKGINTDRLIADSDYAIKMASRDLHFRDAFHKKLEEYIHSISPADFERFLGEQSVSFEKQLEEAKDVFKRLKDSE